MKSSRSFVAATIVIFALMAACSGQPSDIQPDDDPESELLAHTPTGGPPPGPLASPDYTQLNGATVDASGGSIRLSVDAVGNVPRHADAFVESVSVFGYAWADLDTGKGIVAVIHPTLGRDSKQNPDGWHTHPVQLAEGTSESGGTSAFCIVSIERSQGGIAIQDNQMRTNMALKWADLDVTALDVAASFVVEADPACNGSGLGLRVVDTEDL